LHVALILALTSGAAGRGLERTAPSGAGHPDLPRVGLDLASQPPSTVRAASGSSVPWKGAVINTVIGAAAGMFATSELCDGVHCYTRGYITLAVGGAATGASLGAAIQWLLRRSRRTRPHPTLRAGERPRPL